MKPRIGITLGCPCGIGPEIVKKAVKDIRVLKICEPIIFGKICKKHVSPKNCGKISIEAVEDAVKSALKGDVLAIVTAPIDKSHWKSAKSKFLGHTEFLAFLTNTKKVAMMMASPKLKISLVTTHLPLKSVPHSISSEKIITVARLTNNFLKSRYSKLAVCSLNPHAGDNSSFGDEEKKIIIPSIKKLNAEGINVKGPYSADSVFLKAVHGEFDAVIAMYHDQALPVIKTLDFRHTVNITLGLPFVRTSPGHGTAKDIAYKGIADYENMIQAIKTAVEIL